MTEPKTDNEPWQIVFEAPDEWRAELVRGWLLEAGIPALIQSNAVAGYDGILSFRSTHWGDVVAPASRRADALEVIDAALSEDPPDHGAE